MWPSWLVVAALWVMALLVSGRATGDESPARHGHPNVVFIVSDDQHWRDYGFMGHEQLRTPNLDRLARESLVYTRGYVPSSLCCPSLASIITGRYPHEHRIVGNDPPETHGHARQTPEGRTAFAAGRERMNRHLEEWPTLPRLLAGSGYRSLQTGKWWQGHFARGGFTEGMTKGGRHGDEGLAIGRETMQPIREFIGRCRADAKPFFVWYAPMLPHDPHDPPADLLQHYSTKTDSVHVARYWGNVERFDRTVGELLDHLDREQLSADTLVIYVTDNGWIQDPDAPKCGPKSKLSPSEGGLRTPLMLRCPGMIAPRMSESLATTIDIVPTVLAACGVSLPQGLPGVNLLDEEAVAARKQVFGECFRHTLVDLDDPAQSLLWRWTIREQWKLILPTGVEGRMEASGQAAFGPQSREHYLRGEAELFDVLADPDETRNLAAAHPDVVARLKADLDRWWNPARSGVPPRRPNVLVFLSDDLGAHDLGCTGSRFYRTPAIDTLAAAGMRFTRGYAAAPVCSPTRAALVTGRHPARVRITNFIGGTRRGGLLPVDYLQALPEVEVTVPERLRAAGYVTGIFGKWHLGPPASIPRHGFDTTGSTETRPGGGPADDPLHARAIAAQAAKFITANRDHAFFCYVPMHSVHVPLKARADLVAEEQSRAAALPPQGPREIPEGDHRARGVQDLPVYAAMIRELDETVATVLAAVETNGLAGDTVVIFTSDNGGLSTAEGSPTSNLPLRAGKGYLYEGGIRVPLLVRWPGIVAAGSTSDVPATTLDLAATIVDLADVGPAADVHLDGTSLLPVLAGTGTIPPRDLCWHYPHYANQGGRPAGAIISAGREKLVEHFEDGRTELFDLAADEGERKDLAGERPERVAELLERLAAWRRDTAAAMPTVNPEPVDPYGPAGLPGKP
ncbi:MAG: sulfatase-like hydrolase/transferase [Planctomycetia bacterium]|nr:sulfatase-like hydrolase/transferase [Planctomycetia bacterium]